MSLNQHPRSFSRPSTLQLRRGIITSRQSFTPSSGPRFPSATLLQAFTIHWSIDARSRASHDDGFGIITSRCSPSHMRSPSAFFFPSHSASSNLHTYHAYHTYYTYHTYQRQPSFHRFPRTHTPPTRPLIQQPMNNQQPTQATFRSSNCRDTRHLTGHEPNAR